MKNKTANIVWAIVGVLALALIVVFLTIGG